MQAYIHVRNMEYDEVRCVFERLNLPYSTHGFSSVNGDRIRVFSIYYSSEEQLTTIKLSMDCRIKKTSVITHHEETL